MRHTRGFTLIELLVVIAIISILAGIIVPRVAGYIAKAKAARALTEIRGAELALTAMLADSGRSNFNQFFSGALPTSKLTMTPVDPAQRTLEQWRIATDIYSGVFYALLRQGRHASLDDQVSGRRTTTDDDDFTLSDVMDQSVLAKLGDSYMDLPRDPFDNQYQFCPGPWRMPNLDILFRSWRPDEDTDGNYEAYVYDAQDPDGLPGDPKPDGKDGFPADDDATIYIWSWGGNLECDQLFGKFYGELGDEYKGGGDDINSWDPEGGYNRFY